MPKIQIYTQPGCPYCHQALLLLNSKGIAFEQINAPRGTNERQEAIERSGGKTTVPQIFIDDRSIGGYDDLKQLDQIGELDQILKE